MKTYYKNGTMSETKYLIDDDYPFQIQVDYSEGRRLLFYPKDYVIRDINYLLQDLHGAFTNMYFNDSEQYYDELACLPQGILLGGQNSDVSIDKECFIGLVKKLEPCFSSIYKHIYVGDCQYLISTVQNFLYSAEHCFVQYYIQIAQIEYGNLTLGETMMLSSHESRQIAFLLETFFTKLYSILDLMTKIIYELEHPISDFTSITKLRSADLLWGARKHISINKRTGTIFEDCEVIRQIESIRNEAVHNGTWEFDPKVFLKVEHQTIVERYTLFPDFEEGRLSTVKNRRHFFSKGTKVNDVLVLIHDEFYQRLYDTLIYTLKARGGGI